MKAERMSFGISFLIHVTLFILFFAFSGHKNNVVSQNLLTVVLDGQLAVANIGGGQADGRIGSMDKPVKTKNASVAALQKKVVKHVNPENIVENTGSVSNKSCEVISDTIWANGENMEADGVASEGGTSSMDGIGSGMGGRGNGTGFGQDPGRGVNSLKKAYFKEHFAFIRDLVLKNLSYPSVARRMGWTGHLTVSFVISEGGSAENIRIVRSSGYKVLDENAMSTIKSLQPFPNPPVKAEIVIPIEYKIERRHYGT